MANPLSVHEALDRLHELDGHPVAVQGVLHFEFEHVAIWHDPESERRDVDPYGSASSSIWLTAGSGSIRLNERGLEQLHGRKVTVLGTLHGPDPGFGGCGHLSGSPAEILVGSIDRL